MAFATALTSPLDLVAAVFARLTKRLSMRAVAPGAMSAQPAAPVAVHRAVAPRATSLSLCEQWAKLSGVLSSSIANAAAAQEMQQAATRQLDLAQYGLTTLVDELSAVMTVPGHRARNATVHKLASYEIAASDVAPSTGRALAA